MKAHKRNPSDRAYKKGYMAGSEGRSRSGCPHANGDKHQEWINGWRDGREDHWNGFGRSAQAQRLSNL